MKYCILLSLLSIGCAPAPCGSPYVKDLKDYYIGHRVASSHLNDIENSAQALHHAIQEESNLKYGNVEFDLRSTLDNKIVIMHDRDLCRSTGIRGFVDLITYKMLPFLLDGTKIPTLKEFFDIFDNYPEFSSEIRLDLKLLSQKNIKDLINIVKVKQKRYNITISTFPTFIETMQLSKYCNDFLSIRQNVWINSKHVYLCKEN